MTLWCRSRYIIALLLLYASGSTAFAQQTHEATTLRGVVADPSGATVPRADLLIVTADGREHRLTTDETGRFDVAEPLGLPITVVGSARGFEAVAITLDTIAGPVTISLA